MSGTYYQYSDTLVFSEMYKPTYKMQLLTREYQRNGNLHYE